MTTVTAVSPSLDWLASRGLDASDLQALAFIEARRGSITPWAAFTRVLGLTESQAKTRAGHLERAGLCVREVVEDPSRRGPKEVGSRYRVTGLGRAVLERLERAWPEAFAATPRPAAAGRVGVPETTASPSRAPVGPDVRDAPRRLTLDQLRPADRQRITSFPFRLRNLVVAALSEGRAPDVAAALALGLTRAQADALTAFIRDAQARAGQGRATVQVASTKAEDVVAAAPAAPAVVDAAIVPAASLPDGAPRAKATIAEASTYADVANLVLAEVSARASYAPLRSTPSKVVAALPQIVWACVHGSLTDYGPLLKRVRTALKLLVHGRWSVPKGMYPAFAGDFSRTVQLVA